MNKIINILGTITVLTPPTILLSNTTSCSNEINKLNYNEEKSDLDLIEFLTSNIIDLNGDKLSLDESGKKLNKTYGNTSAVKTESINSDGFEGSMVIFKKVNEEQTGYVSPYEFDDEGYAFPKFFISLYKEGESFKVIIDKENVRNSYMLSLLGSSELNEFKIFIYKSKIEYKDNVRNVKYTKLYENKIVL
ncbi:hypothetical protein [Spiroplasma turonicum]|nr:hypothetical protein [Spiroplasma turonicum]ALX70789.1 hypothetical protein STURO_v1c05230 [Spiroplasma turonicum]